MVSDGIGSEATRRGRGFIVWIRVGRIVGRVVGRAVWRTLVVFDSFAVGCRAFGVAIVRVVIWYQVRIMTGSMPTAMFTWFILVLVSTVLRVVIMVDALVLRQYSNTDLCRMVWEIDLAAWFVGIASRVATAGMAVVWVAIRALILIAIRTFILVATIWTGILVLIAIIVSVAISIIISTATSIIVTIIVALVIAIRVMSVILIRHVECEAGVLAQYRVVWEVEVGWVFVDVGGRPGSGFEQLSKWVESEEGALMNPGN
jgi:hypothetical protein